MSRLTERFENFSRAYVLFKMALEAYNKNPQDELNHMALVQGFEIVCDLGWKSLKDYLAEKGIEAYAPKDVIKEAFSINILPNAQIWIDMIKDRNSCSHEYKAEKVNIILENISNLYAPEFEKFINFMESYINGK